VHQHWFCRFGIKLSKLLAVELMTLVRIHRNDGGIQLDCGVVTAVTALNSTAAMIMVNTNSNRNDDYENDRPVLYIYIYIYIYNKCLSLKVKRKELLLKITFVNKQFINII
jgi:hypothetical protein